MNKGLYALEETNNSATVPSVLHPYTDEDFFSNYFELRPLHISRKEPGYFDSVLSAQDIDDYLAAAKISYPEVNMASASDASSAPWLPLPQAGNHLNVVKEEVFKQLAAGNTLILNLLEQKIPKLNKFLCQLAEQWTVALTANAYITPPDNQGFEWHYDDHDVLILQLKGHKRWNVLDEPSFLPDKNYKSRYSKLNNDEGATSYMLQEGDSMYIPRGVYHRARSQKRTSVHLTIAINTSKRYDLFRGLLNAAIGNKEFRKSVLPKYEQPTEIGAQLESMKEFCTNYFDQLLSEANTLKGPTPKNSQQDYHGRLKNVMRIEELSSLTVLSSRTTDFEQRHQGGFIEIRSKGRQLRFPITTEKLLIALLKSSELSVAELPKEGLSEKQRLDIARKLVVEGWIDIV